MGPVGFDLDMTLIDSRPAIQASFAALAEDTGTAIDPVAVDGLGIKLEDELAFWYPPDQRAAAAVIFRRHYVRLAGQMTTVLPGAHEALAAVRAAGQRVVIITAKHPISVQPSLRATGITADEVFTFVHGPEKAAVLRRVAAAVYVGDSPPDMAAAVAAAVRAVGVATGSFSRDDLARAGADVVLDSLAAFPAWYQARPSRRRGRARVRAACRCPVRPPTRRARGPPGNRRRYRIRQVLRVDEQRPGHLPDPRPQRGQRLLAVPPRPGLVLAETGPQAAPEPPCVAAVVAPARQPGRSWPSPAGSDQSRSCSAIWPAASTTNPSSPPPVTPCTRPWLSRPCRMLAELNCAPMASAATTCPASCQAVCTAAVRAGA